MQDVKENGTVGWVFKGVKPNKNGCFDVYVKGQKQGQRKMLSYNIGTAQSGIAGALMFDAALEQRGALGGYNFPDKAEREQVRHKCHSLGGQQCTARLAKR